jgi:hypothetical protein
MSAVSESRPEVSPVSEADVERWLARLHRLCPGLVFVNSRKFKELGLGSHSFFYSEISRGRLIAMSAGDRTGSMIDDLARYLAQYRKLPARQGAEVA